MERQSSCRASPVEKQPSARGVMEKQPSFGRGIEKQKSFRGFMEKQKSFRIVMEKQLSFIGGERKKSKESPGKRGDSQLHLAARGGNLVRVKEILQNCTTSKDSIDLLSKTNQEGETPLYVAAENGHALVVGEMLKFMDLQTASITARNGYDPFHIAARQGHLGKSSPTPCYTLYDHIFHQYLLLIFLPFYLNQLSFCIPVSLLFHCTSLNYFKQSFCHLIFFSSVSTLEL